MTTTTVLPRDRPRERPNGRQRARTDRATTPHGQSGGPAGLATLDAVARYEKLGASHEFGHAPQHVGGLLVS
jgi:hypothetical protein